MLKMRPQKFGKNVSFISNFDRIWEDNLMNLCGRFSIASWWDFQWNRKNLILLIRLDNFLFLSFWHSKKSVLVDLGKLYFHDFEHFHESFSKSYNPSPTSLCTHRFLNYNASTFLCFSLIISYHSFSSNRYCPLFEPLRWSFLPKLSNCCDLDNIYFT